MEEIIQPEIPKIVCPNKKDAKYACCNSKCLKSSFTCFVDDCNCRQTHKDCFASQVSSIVTKVSDAKKNIPQESIKSFIQVQKILQKMIEELSKIKDQLYDARKQFGLRAKQSQFYNHIIKEEFDKINGKLIHSVYQQFKKGQKPKLNKDTDIKTSWNYYQGQFNKMCQEIRRYFKITNKKNLIQKVNNPSKITNDFTLLQQWITPSFKNQIKQFKLLYRATENDFSIAPYQTSCAGVANTLVLIKTQFDKIIGGFNPFAWSSPGHGGYYNDPYKRTFIFSLTQRQKLYNYNNNNSFYYQTNFGPAFGSGHDIYICDKANNSNSNGCVGNSYFSVKFPANQQGYTLFSGQTNGYTFKTKQWQVYQVL